MHASDIEQWFTYHPPTDDQPAKYTELRELCKSLAHRIDDVVPEGFEKRMALERLRETVMWANAGIACGPRGEDA